MAEEPENLVLKMLRDIRATQDEHSSILNEHSRAFERLNRKIDDWGESTATALGLSAHANVRSNHIDEEISELKRRIEKLEQAQ